MPRTPCVSRKARVRHRPRRSPSVSTGSSRLGARWRRPARAPAAAADFVPNAFLRIGSDDSVTVIAKHVELGQGAYTGIATIAAEELDADWAAYPGGERAGRRQALCESRVRHDAGDGRQLRHGEFLDAASRSRRQGARRARGRSRQGVARSRGGARRGQGCGSAPEDATARDVRLPRSGRPLLADPRQGNAQGSPRFQAHRAKSAESRRAGQVRRHRAVHLGHGISRHARGVAAATAALRRDRAELRRNGGLGRAGGGQGRAGPARSRRDRHRLLGCQAWTGRARQSIGTKPMPRSAAPPN